MIVLHLMDREYADVIDNTLPLAEKILLLAREFRDRLTSLSRQLDSRRLLPRKLQQR